MDAAHGREPEGDVPLTVVIPVHNEGGNIAVCIERLERELSSPHAIDIVYDFEEDTTVPVVVLEREKYWTPIRMVRNRYGQGVLNAIKTGLEAAETTFVVVTMADLSDPPSVINDMLETARREDADIVCASRYMKGGRQAGGPFIKGLMSRCAGLTLAWFARVPTHDATNSFKLYRASFLRGQTIESTGGFELGLELVVKAHRGGFRIAEVPTTWTGRVAGESRFRILKWLPCYLKWYFLAFFRSNPSRDG